MKAIEEITEKNRRLRLEGSPARDMIPSDRLRSSEELQKGTRMIGSILLDGKR